MMKFLTSTVFLYLSLCHQAQSLEADMAMGYALKQWQNPATTALANHAEIQETLVLKLDLRRHRWGNRWFPRLPAYHDERNLSETQFDKDKTQSNRWRHQRLDLPLYRINNYQHFALAYDYQLVNYNTNIQRDISYFDDNGQEFKLGSGDGFQHQVKHYQLALYWKGRFSKKTPITGLGLYLQRQERPFGVAMDGANSNSLYQSTIDSAGLMLQSYTSRPGWNINLSLNMAQGILRLPVTPNQGDDKKARILSLVRGQLSLLHVYRISHGIHWHTNLSAQAEFTNHLADSKRLDPQATLDTPWGISGQLRVSF